MQRNVMGMLAEGSKDQITNNVLRMLAEGNATQGP